jgi:hypothetical protein
VCGEHRVRQVAAVEGGVALGERGFPVTHDAESQRPEGHRNQGQQERRAARQNHKKSRFWKTAAATVRSPTAQQRA